MSGRDAPLARPYRPGAFLRWASRRYFAHIAVDKTWEDQVRASAEAGVVVYIMRSLSFLDFFCLHHLLTRLALPLVRFVNDLGLGVFEPFGKGIRRMRLKKQIPEDEALAGVVAQEGSALLFLRRPPRLGRAARRGAAMEGDLIRTLISAQRRMERPILLQPQTFVWDMRPKSQRRGIVDLFFGSVEWPGRVRRFFQFLFNYRNAKLRSGEPLDLQAFMADHEDLTDGQIADKVRYAILRILERERRLVVGPTKKTTDRIMEELIRSPRVRRHIEGRAKSEKKSVAQIEGQAKKELRRLAADQQPWAIAFLDRLLRWVFRRIYDGIVVDEAGIERVRAAARDGTVVFLPSHKSHVDYLVLSYVLHGHALSAPLIAAGENLSFFPLGPLLRRGGAFFIKRSFSGKKLYSALVDAYIRKLLAAGYAIEFFLEGGRSRTGKLLPPKLGLLSMVVDATLKTRRTVYFVPVSIGYERIVEERSYVHELGGGEKQQENVGGLLRTPKVLRSKYGRLYVQFGEAVTLADMHAEAMRDDDAEKEHAPLQAATLTPPQRRALVQRLASRVTTEIDRVTVVTPAALVASTLLVHRRRGIDEETLMGRVELVLGSLEAAKAQCASAIRDGEGKLRHDTIQEAVALFLDSGLIRQTDGEFGPVYRVPDQRRIALEYYKNNILHFFVARAMLSAALLREEGPTTEEVLLQRVAALSDLFRFEFVHQDGNEEQTRAVLRRMRREGDVLTPVAPMEKPEQQNAAGFVAAGGQRGLRLRIHAEMLRSYMEAYLLALQSCLSGLSDQGELKPKEWLSTTMDRGQRAYLAGRLELRESISKPKLEGALRVFRAMGLIKQERGSIRLADETAARALEQELEAYLRA